MKTMNIMRKILLLSLLALATLVACDPITDETPLGGVVSEKDLNINVYNTTSGGNQITMVNHTKGVGSYWDYIIGRAASDSLTVALPFLGKQTIRFVGLCDGGTVETTRTVDITTIDHPTDVTWSYFAGTGTAGKRWTWNRDVDACYGDGGWQAEWVPDWDPVAADDTDDPGGSMVFDLNGGPNVTIYDAGGKATAKGTFTFDMNGSLVWVIVAHTSASATPSPTPSPTPRPTPTPAPDGSPGPSGSPGQGGTPSPSGGPGGGGHGGGGRISFGRGGAKTTPKPLYVIAKTELCTVTPRERMLITVSIDELDVLALSLGQAADLSLDALPTTGLTATVTKIDPEGENNGGNTKYAVTLALERSEQLYPGMNGTVCFPRREGKAVLTVPLVAVTEEGDRMLVYTAYNEETDELLSPVTVQTGVSDGTDVEIVSGLALGDTYYYRYADAISYVTGEAEG